MNQLARIDAEEASSMDAEDLHKYLCFYLGEKIYGITILRVKEIMEHVEVAPIPMMPEFFWGAINLRGNVVPVIDVSQRLGMDRLELGKKTCFIIVEIRINEQIIDAGIVVDAVNQVADIPPENREPAPSFAGNINNDYVDSIGKVGENFVILLEVDRVLSMADLSAISQSELLQESVVQNESDTNVEVGDKDKTIDSTKEAESSADLGDSEMPPDERNDT